MPQGLVDRGKTYPRSAISNERGCNFILRPQNCKAASAPGTDNAPSMHFLRLTEPTIAVTARVYLFKCIFYLY